MTTHYYRPETLSDALDLLKKTDAVPLGGGTLLAHTQPAPTKVIDLQALHLNELTNKGNNQEIGATVTLQQFLEDADTLPALKSALKLEAPLNIRNAATVAGTLVAANGRSTFAATMLALDAKISVQPGEKEFEIGNFLPLRDEKLGGKLITALTIPLNVKLTFESVARTPADKPIICAALAKWPSGRTRLALGGYGKSPLLAMDGTESDDLETAARNAFHEAADEWASADYRMDVSATLARRCLEAL